MRQPIFLLVLLSATAAIAAAQVSIQSASGSFTRSRTFNAPPFIPNAVHGAPYSAERVTETQQTLADGTHITHAVSVKIYRDSAGRIRTERPMFPSGTMAAARADSTIIVEITDPVAQIKYTLDPVNKVAHMQRPVTPPYGNAAKSLNSAGVGTGVMSQTATATFSRTSPDNTAAAGTALNQSNRLVQAHSKEDLGTSTIEGVLVTGHRYRTTWPAGSMGNDRDISTVHESWISTELGEAILTKTSDPRSGEITNRLTNISRTEPPADLFQPPADYTVVEEADRFTITVSGQQ